MTAESPPTATPASGWSLMSPRLDLPIGYLVWLTGFAWVARTGSWMVLAVLQVLAAARLLAGDPDTRRLFRPSGLAVVVGLAGAVLSVILTYGLYTPFAALFPRFAGAVRELYVVMNSAGYERGALVAIVTVVIVAEEIVWRGRVLDMNAGGTRRTVGWQIAQSLLFGALYAVAHLTSGSALLVFIAFAFGAAWALLRILTGSIWTPLIAHVLWDMAVLVVWPVF